MLTQYFPPEMGAPQVRLSELGERLITRDWEVEALTALPNYPTGHVLPGYSPWRAVSEKVGNIRTVRVPLYPAKQGFVRRLASYFSFGASAAVFGPSMIARPDVLFVESPPLFIGYAARYLAWRWKCPYVLNVSDLWPESAIRMGIVKPGIATAMAQRLERWLYRGAAAVTGQSDEIIAGVRAVEPQVRTLVVTNGVDPQRFGRTHADRDARTLLGDEPGPVFVYAGLLGWAQGLDQILDLARSIPEAIAGRFVLIGEGPERERLARRIAEERIDRVRLVGAQPRDRIPKLLAAADAAVITLGMNLPGAVPSKIYEAMASELPILLVASGEAAKRVRDAKAGLAIDPGDTDGLRQAFFRLASDVGLRHSLGSAGRRAAETTYHRDRIAGELDEFLRGVLVRRETGRAET